MYIWNFIYGETNNIIIVALFIAVGIHLQILQEEKHMKEVFKKEYNEYANKTPRYILF